MFDFNKEIRKPEVEGSVFSFLNILGVDEKTTIRYCLKVLEENHKYGKQILFNTKGAYEKFPLIKKLSDISESIIYILKNNTSDLDTLIVNIENIKQDSLKNQTPTGFLLKVLTLKVYSELLISYLSDIDSTDFLIMDYFISNNIDIVMHGLDFAMLLDYKDINNFRHLRKYIKKIAKQRNEDAIFLHALWTLTDEKKIRYYNQALEWLENSSTNGHEPSSFLLGLMHIGGIAKPYAEEKSIFVHD